MTRNENSWCSTQLRKALDKRNVPHACFSFPHLVARVAYRPKTSVGEINVLEDLDAIIVRPIGRGSLEEIIFRMDLLHRLERLGVLIVNPPSAIEHAVDKFYALTLLEETGLPVPRTVVTEDAKEALKAFYELNGDIILKPIFGSRGIGSTRISDPNVAERIFRAVTFHHGVLYLQEYVPHGTADIRAFIIGNHVVASMQRVNVSSWKTNVSQGAKPMAIKLNKELEGLAVKAAETVGCEIAGVDILEGENGPLIIEVNSQPGWKGLQSVTKVKIAGEIIDYMLKKLET